LLIEHTISACVTSAVRIYYNVLLRETQTDVTHQLGILSFWGTAQIPAGFLIICLPSVPKTINYIRAKPWCTKLQMSLRSMLQVPTESVRASTRIITIGGGDKRNLKGTVVSDVEFRELMADDATSVASTTRTNPVSQSRSQETHGRTRKDVQHGRSNDGHIPMRDNLRHC
jgi:hypothetical protein